MTYEHPRIPVLLDPERFPAFDLGGDRLLPVSAPGEDGRPRHALPGTKERPVPLLAYAAETFLGKLVGVMVAERGESLHLAHIYENPMAEALKVMAITGRGIAWLPETSVRAEIASGALVVVDPAMSIDMRIRIYRSMDKMRPSVERLWRYLKERSAAAAVAAAVA